MIRDRAAWLAVLMIGASLPLQLRAEPAPATPTAQALDPATREIWRSAWVWEARGRGDLARAALEKLLRTRPRLPALVDRLRRRL